MASPAVAPSVSGIRSFLECGARQVDLSRTAVMGILNVTPDSFSDGGAWRETSAAVARGERLAAEGADIIDVGGESTRPGAAPVPVHLEIERVVPVIERLARLVDVPVSIDTSKPEVMQAAVAAGATLINDVQALRAPGAAALVAELAVPVCLMHMRGAPRTMQHNPVYTDVVGEVRAFLAERFEAAHAAGIPREQIVLDPGFGFGKTVAHNLALLRGLEDINALGCPVLVGLSRKSMIGALLDLPVTDRLHASVALALIAARNGAAIVRVHDVRATREALRTWEAVYPHNRPETTR